MAAASLVKLLFLVTAGVLLSSSEAQEALDKLPDIYRKGVDLALQQLHSHQAVQHHFLYFKTIHKSVFEAGFNVKYIYHNFYLKATKCSKGTTNPDRCQFRNDRPLMDCVFCCKTIGNNIEKDPKPYINCLHRPSLTQDVTDKRRSHCDKMSYSSGAPTLLASRV